MIVPMRFGHQLSKASNINPKFTDQFNGFPVDIKPSADQTGIEHSQIAPKLSPGAVLGKN